MGADLQRIRQRIARKYRNNQIAAYKAYLLELSRLFPPKRGCFWEHLSAFSMSKGRKIVARTPEDLYASSPHLNGPHAYRIAPGWWLDTNISKEGKMQRLKIAQTIYLENVTFDDEPSRP